MREKKMIKFLEFISNNDGRRSTTAFIQFTGFFVLAGVLVYAVFLDRAVAELYAIFAAYCGGLVVSKGVVTAYKDKNANKKTQNTE